MKQMLLEFFKYVAEHPEKTLNQAFSMNRFHGVYWFFQNVQGSKPLTCPTCGEHKPLTKHHVIPKKNGGKGVIGNYFYICRSCHDHVHEMFTKKQKIEKYMLEHPNATVEEVMAKFKAKKKTAMSAMFPEYYLRCQIKYELKVGRRVQAGMEWINHPEQLIRVI